MKTVFADFNAMTEEGDLRLDLNGSKHDRREQNIAIGDWTWLSDGELVVGALVRSDAHEGVVGTPRWQTLVHLDDEETKDYLRVITELNLLLLQPSTNLVDAARTFQLLTILASLEVPAGIHGMPRSTSHFCRANALLMMGECELALIEIVAARNERPGDGYLKYLHA